jgi:hypothetical protein
VYFEGDQLCYRGREKLAAIKKVISRLVDVDFKKFLKKMQAEGKPEVIETLRRIYATPALWPDCPSTWPVFT